MLNEGGIDLGMQDTLRAIADPTRREILNLLKHSRLSAGEICNHFSVSDAAVSRHLSVLKDADLIRDEREGKFIYYAWILGNVTRIPRHELPQTLDFSDFLPLFT